MTETQQTVIEITLTSEAYEGCMAVCAFAWGEAALSSCADAGYPAEAVLSEAYHRREVGQARINSSW